MIERSIPASTHGRYLAIPTVEPGPAPLLVGFHGYGEDAETQLARLKAIPGSDRWLIISIQGLHQFYNRRLGHVVASWMTRLNREEAIADNAAYVSACLAAVQAQTPALPTVVFAGFSQGVAMAFRAAAGSTRRVAGVISVGGDVPPELTPEDLKRIPAALIARGASDPLYSAEQFMSDEQRLRQASVDVRTITLQGGHEWSAEFAADTSQFLARLHAAI